MSVVQTMLPHLEYMTLVQKYVQVNVIFSVAVFVEAVVINGINSYSDENLEQFENIFVVLVWLLIQIVFGIRIYHARKHEMARIMIEVDAYIRDTDIDGDENVGEGNKLKVKDVYAASYHYAMHILDKRYN